MAVGADSTVIPPDDNSTTNLLSPQDTSTPEPEHEPFPTLPVAAAYVGITTVVSTGLLLYFKKRKR